MRHVRLHRWERTTLIERVLYRIHARAPQIVRCLLVAVRPQYLVVRAPGGEELWIERDGGRVTSRRGGHGAGAAAVPEAWRGWTLYPRDLDGLWCERSQHGGDGSGCVTASGARRARARAAQGG